MNYAATLRDRIKQRPLLLVGAASPICVLQMYGKGFGAAYVSGAAVSTMLGRQDTGHIKLKEMAILIKQMIEVGDLPLIVDCDTGLPSGKRSKENEYGAIIKTVTEIERAGAAAIQIEDQVHCDKLCGHSDGKKIIGRETMEMKIKLACLSRKNKDTMIIVRTDARAIEGMQGAIRRAMAYRDAGADAIFPEALESLTEFYSFRNHITGPLLANLAEHGKTPSHIFYRQLFDMGYQMALIPATPTRAMLKTHEDALNEILKRGGMQQSVNEKKILTRDEISQLIKNTSKPYKP